ncbi:MAG: dTDP-4-dehydrorhamnose reductase [Ramlibacter sp.]|nr:dTDP-4-dehydrorhamnose reductase [Ramlibacter sp.]
MKILLFGAQGQVGWELQRSLAPLGELVAPGRAGTELCGDFHDVAGLVETVQAVRPQVIVNAAAYTAVDRAESEPEVARLINATAPGALAQAAQAVGAWFIHYSTDYVFDGSGEQAWNENDHTAPINVYGHTKLNGEQLVRGAGAQHLILRTSWVYGARGRNFAKTMLRLAAERSGLEVVDDQVGAPTGADLLADLTALALRSLLRGDGRPGLYHVAASGETTWNAYARFVIAHAQRSGAVLNAGVEDVKPIPTSVFPTQARRPHNSRLDTSSFRRAFCLTLPRWELGVARMLDEILGQQP